MLIEHEGRREELTETEVAVARAQGQRGPGGDNICDAGECPVGRRGRGCSTQCMDALAKLARLHGLGEEGKSDG